MSATQEASLALPEDLGIERAGELHASLAPHVDAAAVTLDGSGVGRVHTAGLQVLLAFVHTRAAAGRATRWRAPSPALRKGAASLGLQELLALPAAVAR